jgi:transcriptional regulator with XRE-family HTH domain
MMNENPVKLAREKLGLNRHQMAVMAGTGVVSIYQLERGSFAKVPRGIEAVLERLGVDTVRLHRDYIAWREAEAARMFAEVQKGLHAESRISL